MNTSKAEIIAAIEDLVEMLGSASFRRGREVELIVRDDGELSLMVGDEAGTTFSEEGRYADVGALMVALEEESRLAGENACPTEAYGAA